MWVTYVVGVIVVMCCGCAFSDQQQVVQEGVIWDNQLRADIPDTPEYAKYADNLFDRVQAKLTGDINSLKTSINMVRMKVDNVCGEQVSQAQINANELTELKGKLETTESKLEEALEKITALQTALQENTEHLAKSQDLDRIKDVVVSKLDEMKGSITTKAQLEELLDANIRKVLEGVTEAREECGSDAKLTEVLQKVNEVKGSVENVTTATEAAKEEARRCTEEGATHVEGVKTNVAELQGKVQALDNDLVGRFENLEWKVEEILNFTLLPPPTLPPPTTTTQGPPGTVYPCEDSTFQGTSALSVCQSAVRFKKCHLESVAYHCCHTCTAENQLPEMGPWRYLNRPRTVSTLDVMRFFML